MKKKTYPFPTEHLPRQKHADSSDHARFRPQEAMIQECDLHQELAKRPGLNVVVVGFRDSASPRVRGAVGGDVEFERLKRQGVRLGEEDIKDWNREEKDERKE